jgi:hypothetical protein
MRGGFKVFVSGAALVAMTFAGASVATAQNATPAQPDKPAEPAAPRFTLNGDAAIVTMLIKSDKTADFEFVLNKLKEALAKSEKPERKQQAAGWKVFKSSQPGPNNTAVYIFRIDPIVKGAEYDITMLISEVFPVEVQEIFAKYKDAFAGRAVTELSQFMMMQ